MWVFTPGVLCDKVLKVAGMSSFYRCGLFMPVYSHYVTAQALNL